MPPKHQKGLEGCFTPKQYTYDCKPTLEENNQDQTEEKQLCFLDHMIILQPPGLDRHVWQLRAKS